MSIFICGITGNQGSSIATHLLASSPPIPIHGLTRNPSSPAAQHISSLGATLTPGSYDDIPALTSAISGCKALFLNLNPDFTNSSAELTTAKQILTIAKTAGVQHVLYSSGPSCDNPQALPLWDPNIPTAGILLSKQAIENEVRGFGFKYYTILRPGSFMSNFVQPLVRMYAGLVEKGRWNTALRPDSILPLVDVDTIGRFGAAAFLDPGRFDKQEIELADEFLLPDQVLSKLGRATGRDLQVVYMTDEEVEAQKGANPFVAGMVMMRDLAGFVDLEKVKSWGMPVSSMDKFIAREKERVLETYKQDERQDEN